MGEPGVSPFFWKGARGKSHFGRPMATQKIFKTFWAKFYWSIFWGLVYELLLKKFLSKILPIFIFRLGVVRVLIFARFFHFLILFFPFFPRRPTFFPLVHFSSFYFHYYHYINDKMKKMVPGHGAGPSDPGPASLC